MATNPELENVRVSISSLNILLGEVFSKEADKLRQIVLGLEAAKTHGENKNNPHKVTQAQVGLSEVQNFPLADTTIGVLGQSNEHYMTPLTVKAAITEQILNEFEEHRDNFYNPHRVDKAQVGLGLVENYPVATQVQAEEIYEEDENGDTVEALVYMTPLRTRQAITVFAEELAQAFEEAASDLN